MPYLVIDLIILVNTGPNIRPMLHKLVIPTPAPVHDDSLEIPIKSETVKNQYTKFSNFIDL